MTTEDKSWNEYRLLHIETFEWLKAEVRKNHDDILTMKVEARFTALIWGVVGGLVTGVSVAIVSALILKAVHLS